MFVFGVIIRMKNKIDARVRFTTRVVALSTFITCRCTRHQINDLEDEEAVQGRTKVNIAKNTIFHEVIIDVHALSTCQLGTLSMPSHSQRKSWRACCIFCRTKRQFD